MVATDVVALVRAMVPWVSAPSAVAPSVPPAAIMPADWAIVPVDHILRSPAAASTPPDWVTPPTPVATEPGLPATPLPAPIVSTPSDAISPAD